MDSIVKALGDFGKVYSDSLAKANAKEKFDETTSGLSNDVEPIVSAIQSTLDTMNSALIEQKETLQESISDAANQVKDLNDTVSSYHKDIDELDDTIEDTKQMRQIAIMAMFGLSIACIVFGFIGVVSYWTTCKWDDFLIYLLNVTWFLGSIVVTLG